MSTYIYICLVLDCHVGNGQTMNVKMDIETHLAQMLPSWHNLASSEQFALIQDISDRWDANTRLINLGLYVASYVRAVEGAQLHKTVSIDNISYKWECWCALLVTLNEG